MTTREAMWKRIAKACIPVPARPFVKRIVDCILLATGLDVTFYYDEAYARGHLERRQWVDAFCEVVLDIFRSRSVIDIGCNIGVILSGFEKKGLDVFGVDGSRMAMRHLQFDRRCFKLLDLRRLFIADRRYDLCICFEVAEHIEERYAATLVRTVTGASPLVFFSAAPPSQPGDCHFNCKPMEWWVEQFRQQGFVFDRAASDILRSRIRDIPEFPGYYINNIRIFRQAEARATDGDR